MTFVLAGLDIEEKARLAEETLWKLVGGREQFAESRVTLRRGDRPDPGSNEDAFAYLTIAVKDPDPQKVGRALQQRAIEMALASYPGFSDAPGRRATHRRSASTGRRWCRRRRSSHRVVDRRRGDRRAAGRAAARASTPPPAARPSLPSAPGGPTRAVPLGTICGARSGDKGGNANVGVWVRTPGSVRVAGDRS